MSAFMLIMSRQMMNLTISTPDAHSLGPLVFTATVNAWIQDRSDLLLQIGQRCDLYRSGDWGDLCEDDWQANINTIQSAFPGERLMGAYKLMDGRRLWITTTGYGTAHAYTTVMSPEDY
jgi:hypothetical protein